MHLGNRELETIKKEFCTLLSMLQMSGGGRYKIYFTELQNEEDPVRCRQLMVGNNFWGGSGSVFDFEADTQSQNAMNLRQLRRIGELIKESGFQSPRVKTICEIIDEWISTGIL